MGEPIPGLDYAEFREEALRHSTETSFRRSPFFQKYGRALLDLLSTPRIERLEEDRTGDRTPKVSARPRPLRLVHWNIEKGKRLEAVLDRLTKDPLLREADLYTFNEVDVGMARSGANADVGRALAAALGCSLVYLPGYLECTKGPGEEGQAPGENELGLHGSAILSRLPVREAKAHLLPPCFDYFSFPEKRFGSRSGLYVEVDWDGRPLVLATTHLEVRKTPSCRARQFETFLHGLEQFRPRATPVLLSGDWNTNTFQRGGLFASARELLRILSSSRERLDAELVRPGKREPLFDRLDRAGFAFEPFNDREPTLTETLGRAEELDQLPGFLARSFERRAGLGGRTLRMRLDWIAGRGLCAAAPPRTLSAAGTDGPPASDHALIVAEFGLAAR